MKAYRLPLVLAAVLICAAMGECKDKGKDVGFLLKPGEPRTRIALIPFETASPQFEAAAQCVTQEAVARLMAFGVFEVVDPGIVYGALSEIAQRNVYGLDKTTMDDLQKSIGEVRAFVVGLVQESGEVRIGPESYPALTVSARIVDARTGSLLWVGSATRTGADGEIIFGIGAEHSVGRVSRAAVKSLFDQLDEVTLVEYLALPVAEEETPDGQSIDGAPSAGPGGAAPPARGGATGKYMDEKAEWPEASLKAALGEVEGFTRGPIRFDPHHFSRATTSYQGAGFEVDVRLADYRTVDAALALTRSRHAGETEQQVFGLVAFGQETPAPFAAGGYHLDVAVGRLGLHMRGPAAHQAEMQKLAEALIAAMGQR